jgi:hypothetical protein
MMADAEKAGLLLDRAHINDHVHRYPVTVDRRDWTLFRSLFTDEVEVLLITTARADRPFPKINCDRFVRATEKILRIFSITQHFLTDYRIDITGDDATCRCYMQARHLPAKDRPQQPIWDVGGYYDFHLRRRGERWIIPKYKGSLTWEINRPPDLTIDL